MLTHATRLRQVVGNGAWSDGEALNELYRNDGQGVFTLVSGSSISASSGNTVALAFGDYDGDGDM